MSMYDLSSADAFDVSPHNTNRNDAVALWVGGAGDVRVTTERGNAVTFTAVPAGTYLPVRVTKVLAATTATNIVGFRL